MENKKYERAKELKEMNLKLASDLEQPLKALKDNLEEFYDLMRWQPLE